MPRTSAGQREKFHNFALHKHESPSSTLRIRAILLRMLRLVILAVAMTFVTPFIPHAAEQAASQPAERARDLLAVDFAAVGADGKPVVSLRADEVTVKIGGRVRPVRSLQLIQTTPGAAAASALPAPFGTNATDDSGRTFVLAVDEDSFRPGSETPFRDAVDALVKGLGARDRLALVTMPYGGIKIPFTTDHVRVRTAVSQLVGKAPTDQTGSDLACRSRRTLESLVGYLELLGIREEPATIMFVSAGLAGPRRDAPVSMAPGMCELGVQLFEQVGVAAGAARAQFYIIQPGDALSAGGVSREGIGGAEFRGSDNPMEGLEHLAGITGGRMLQMAGSAETALGRVLRETSTHYIATIDPDRNDRSGRSQQLEIRAKREGVEVRARPRITFAQPEPGMLSRNPSPREMLGVATVFRDLPMRGTGYAALDADGRAIRVVTMAEAVEPGVTFGSLSAALFDADGKLVSHWAATPAELERTPVVGAMPAAPGAYRLRVAAIDTSGRSGTADFPVTADLARTGPLTLSSLVLGLSRSGAFAPRMQFGEEPVAIGFLELYGAAAGAKVSASLDVANTANGAALVTVPLVIAATGPDRYSARGAIPIGALPPGDYTVRAMVGLEGHPSTRVVATLRKVVR